jgi:Mg-chelatase subunit ChlD
MSDNISAAAVTAVVGEPHIDVAYDMNTYLDAGADTLETLVTLKPVGFDGVIKVAIEQNIFFLLDVSVSMNEQNGAKLAFAKSATINAIKMLPETAYFAVITFSESYDVTVALVQATPANKAAAIARVQALRVIGGTKMSRGLSGVIAEQKKRPKAACDVVMLTDGGNNEDDEERLHAVLDELKALAQKGMPIQVHARGVGQDFTFAQVRLIAEATRGKPAAYIAEPAKLEADFAALIEAASKNAVSDARLNIWMPNIVTLKKVNRTEGGIQTFLDAKTKPWDIATQGNSLGFRTVGKTYSFPLGSLGAEVMEFLVAFGLAAKPAGQTAKAGEVWISYLLNGKLIQSPPQAVVGEWTPLGDPRSQRIAPGVARANGDLELATEINDGLTALAKGDAATATVKFGRATKIIHDKGGDVEKTRALTALVDVQDAATGTVKLKKGAASDRDATLRLEAASVRTVATKKATPAAPAAADAPKQP